MSDIAATIDTYLAAWTEPDSHRRATLVEQVWGTEGRLTDPPFAAEGHTAIAEMAAALQVQFPGHRFRRTSGIDTHHDEFRFAWELVGADGTAVLTGIDVGACAEDGRLARITGFFGDLPARDVP